MKLLNWFVGLFRKKKAAPDDLAVKIERRLDDRTLWAEITEGTEEIKTDAAIIGDDIHHISITPEEYRRITGQLNYNQLSQFATMELAKRRYRLSNRGNNGRPKNSLSEIAEPAEL